MVTQWHNKVGSLLNNNTGKFELTNCKTTRQGVGVNNPSNWTEVMESSVGWQLPLNYSLIINATDLTF